MRTSIYGRAGGGEQRKKNKKSYVYSNRVRAIVRICIWKKKKKMKYPRRFSSCTRIIVRSPPPRHLSCITEKRARFDFSLFRGETSRDARWSRGECVSARRPALINGRNKKYKKKKKRTDGNKTKWKKTQTVMFARPRDFSIDTRQLSPVLIFKPAVPLLALSRF